MYMSARDLAKFGQLFLDGGRHGNRQLIPAAWVSESTRSHSQIGSGFEGYGFGGYGYMWWVAKENTPFSGSHAASGVGGRFLVVMPRIRAVLVIHNQDKQGQPVPIMAPGALPRLMTMLVAAAGA
jgi:CubicO group peptidase (beta-lactamase class C family)